MENKSSAKQTINIVIIISLILLVISIVLYKILNISVFLTIAISAGTTCYHFAIRVIIGKIIDGIFHNHMNYKRKWFQPKKFEEKLYKFLKVKKWKDKMPTYVPDTFSVKDHSMEELIETMCQSEIAHELNIIASLVPISFSLFFGMFYIFLITSILGAMFDTLLVMMQRYNRPRLLKFAERKNKNNKKDTLVNS